MSFLPRPVPGSEHSRRSRFCTARRAVRRSVQARNRTRVQETLTLPGDGVHNITTTNKNQGGKHEMTVLRPGVLDDLDVSNRAESEAVLQSAIRKAALRF